MNLLSRIPESVGFITMVYGGGLVIAVIVVTTIVILIKNYS